MAHFDQMLNNENMNFRIDDKSSFTPVARDESLRSVKPGVRPKRPMANTARTAVRPRPAAPVEQVNQQVPELLRMALRAPSDNDVLTSVMQQIAQEKPAKTTAPAKVRAEPEVTSEPTSNTSVSWKSPGFHRLCRVSTSFGDLPVEALRLRDQVKTLSGAYKQVQWIDKIRLDADFLRRHPEAHPIQLRARSLGGTQPGKNMLVSPGQMLHATGLIGNIKKGMAAEFDGYPSINRLQQTEITYYRFHCGEPETVCIEGAWFCVSP